MFSVKERPKQRNQVNGTESENILYKFSRNFWPLLPRLRFWGGAGCWDMRILGYWDLISNLGYISNFLNS